jgi:hypothetical protein
MSIDLNKAPVALEPLENMIAGDAEEKRIDRALSES